MSYVYLSDIGQMPAPAPTPAAPATAATAESLEAKAKALELTAQVAAVASPAAAANLQAQAAAMRQQATQIRNELGGLSTGAKVGIAAAILGSIAGGYHLATRNKTRANGRRRR